MTRILKTTVLGLVAFAGAVAVGAAQARSDVYWSVGINAPGYPVGVGASFSNAPVVYARPVYWAAPPPVYYAPPPVYYAPRPVYVQPAPVYYYESDAYYYDYGDRRKHRRHPRFRDGY